MTFINFILFLFKKDATSTSKHLKLEEEGNLQQKKIEGGREPLLQIKTKFWKAVLLAMTWTTSLQSLTLLTQQKQLTNKYKIFKF